MPIKWTDKWGGKHNVGNNAATATLQKFYDERPGGLEEIESACEQAKRAGEKLKSLGYENEGGEWVSRAVQVVVPRDKLVVTFTNGVKCLLCGEMASTETHAPDCLLWRP